MENQSATLSPGTVVKGPKRSYTVLTVLGQGGFGITYLVSGKVKVDNIVLEGRFALKEHFISSLCSREGVTQAVQFSAPVAEEVDRSMMAFIKEAQRLQSLGIDHPNIVRINEVFEANNTAYYVMEYLGGTTLQDYVSRSGAMSPAAAKSLLRPVVEAVAMLHHNNIAHYDIKPGNIMLHEGDNGTVRPVLIDFGLSKHYNDRGHATSTLAAAGYTPGYAPAEQYAGIKQFSPQCDVYALAATLYFCMTGHDPKPAFELSPAEVERELSVILPAAEVAPILRALSTMPATRTADASAFLAEVFNGNLAPQPQSRPQPRFENKQPSGSATVKLDTTPAPKRKRFPIIAAIVAIVAVAIVVLLMNRKDTAPTAEVENIEIVPDDKDESEPGLKYENLDLYATRDGKDYFFSPSEWRSLPETEKSLYDRKGIVVIGNGLEFVLALHDSGESIEWDEAMSRYGDLLPSKAQAEVMAKQCEAINNAIIAFGGDKDPRWTYWTKTVYEEDSSHVWIVIMNGGGVNNYYNRTPCRVRTVAPIPTDLK